MSLLPPVYQHRPRLDPVEGIDFTSFGGGKHQYWTFAPLFYNNIALAQWLKKQPVSQAQYWNWNEATQAQYWNWNEATQCKEAASAGVGIRDMCIVN